jgi:hypothetical protein
MYNAKLLKLLRFRIYDCIGGLMISDLKEEEPYFVTSKFIIILVD